MSQHDEEADGFKVKALTLTYQTGRYAGSEYGRELIGYVPWQFSMPDAGKGYEAAWKKLMDKDGFAAPFGPTTVERNDPMFLLKKTCCWWSGQSWPYATSQTLKAMANLLQDYDQKVGHAGGLRQAPADVREDAPQGRQALPRRGVPPRHRLVRGARRLQPQRALLPLVVQRPRHHRPGRAATARRRRRSR